MVTKDKFLTFNLSQLRTAKGLTQEALAERSGLSLNGYQQIEYGRRMPSGKSLLSIANALEVSVEDLFRDPVLPSDSGYVRPTEENRINKKTVGELSVEELAVALDAYSKAAKEISKPSRTTKEQLIDRIAIALATLDEDELSALANSYERRVTKKSINSRRIKTAR